MSRVGNLLIPVPSGVTVDVETDNLVRVKGPKGELHERISRDLTIEQDNGTIRVRRPNNQSRLRQQHGLARTLINNMVLGVTAGHEKTLDVQGVGFRAQVQGQNLVLSVGYSHPVTIEAPQGITLSVDADEKARKLRIKVWGIDKAKVGQIAADIRKVRPPDVYKGKGVRYLGEVVKLKAGKRAAAKK